MRLKGVVQKGEKFTFVAMRVKGPLRDRPWPVITTIDDVISSTDD